MKVELEITFADEVQLTTENQMAVAERVATALQFAIHRDIGLAPDDETHTESVMISTADVALDYNVERDTVETV